jgi:uncharacterized membrane protein YccC
MPGSDSSLASRAVDGARHGLLTAAAAWISYISTSWVGLHEGYWAAISAIVVMQVDLAATRNSGRDRFLGTALGGVLGWGCAVLWHGHVWIYALAVAASVFLCWLAGMSAAGRLAGVAVTVIVLIPRDEAVWRIALFRFLEVSWGIAVGVALGWFEAWLARRRPEGKE